MPKHEREDFVVKRAERSQEQTGRSSSVSWILNDNLKLPALEFLFIEEI